MVIGKGLQRKFLEVSMEVFFEFLCPVSRKPAVAAQSLFWSATMRTLEGVKDGNTKMHQRIEVHEGTTNLTVSTQFYLGIIRKRSQAEDYTERD